MRTLKVQFTILYETDDISEEHIKDLAETGLEIVNEIVNESKDLVCKVSEASEDYSAEEKFIDYTFEVEASGDDGYGSEGDDVEYEVANEELYECLELLVSKLPAGFGIHRDGADVTANSVEFTIYYHSKYQVSGKLSEHKMKYVRSL
jgi:hypothetical protein